MANWGMKVSKPGFDVKTCDDKDLVFTSKLKLFVYGFSIQGTGNTAHELGYIPTFFTVHYFDVYKYGIVGQIALGGIAYVDATNYYSDGVNTTAYIFYNQVTYT